MEPGNLETLLEKVRTVAQGPQGDLLRKFVDLLYKPMGERKRQGQSRSKAYREQAGQVNEHRDRP